MRKKIMLLMCMAALLVAFFSLGVVGANQVPPEVTVVAARVDNGAALELGLRIDSKNDSFQSTGVVLEYDASALKPCGWADEVTDELLNKAKVDPTALAEGETMWDHAVPLPTKGKDIISGKTAFTVIDSTTNKGYLYLSVEAPTPTNVPVQAPAPLYGLNQVQPSEMGLEGLEELAAGNGFQSNHGLIDATSAVDQVITVRFALPTETPEPPVNPPVEPTPDPENPTPNPDETDEPSTQADETGDGSEGGDGTGEGGGEPTEPGPTDPTDPDNPDTPENPDDPPAETAEDFMAKYGIKVAEDATAVNSPAGRSGTYFYTTDTEPVDILNWHFLSVKNGISVNSGGTSGPPSPDDFCAIVFYDWDDTYMGAVVMPKTATTEHIDKYLSDFVSTRYAGYTEGMTFPADLANESYIADEKTPLTYKKGYNFAGWVEVNGEGTPTLQDSFTAYPSMGEPDEDGHYPERTFNAEKWDYSQLPENGWDNITLKAGYVENAHCNEAPTDGWYYSTGESSYRRTGATATANYPISFTVKRENALGNGVTRLRDPAVRIVMKTNSGDFVLLQKIDKSDTATVEVVGPKTVNSVEIFVIDAAAEWVSAATVAVGKVEETAHYLREGTITYLNELIVNGEVASLDTATCTDIGLTYNGQSINTIRLRTVRTNLQKLTSDPNYDGKRMTFEQLQHGANTGTWIPAS